jgi:hypothetical protein
VAPVKPDRLLGWVFVFLGSASPHKFRKQRAANHRPRITPACRDFADSSRVLPDVAELLTAHAAFAQRALRIRCWYETESKANLKQCQKRQSISHPPRRA